MKNKIIYVCTFAVMVALLAGYFFGIYLPKNEPKVVEQNNTEKYTRFGDSVNVYNEHDDLVGVLIDAQLPCGSDNCVDVLFLKVGYMDKSEAKIIPELGGHSLGLAFAEKDKNIYRSTFIWAPSEGHFGCHYFKVEKVIYVNGNFELKDDFVTNKKYAFDLGDAQGKCDLFPGLEKILKEKNI